MHQQRILSLEMDGIKIVLGELRQEVSQLQEQSATVEEDDFLKIQSMVNHMDNGVIYAKEQ